MKIFISYPSEEKTVAEEIAISLRASGHIVFLDKESLSAGLSFTDKIAVAIRKSDLFLFLISPAALERGRFTLTELGIAGDTWPSPNGRVLPVMLRPTPVDRIPGYLRQVTILETHGHIATAVCIAVEGMNKRRVSKLVFTAGLLGLTSVILTVVGTPKHTVLCVDLRQMQAACAGVFERITSVVIHESTLAPLTTAIFFAIAIIIIIRMFDAMTPRSVGRVFLAVVIGWIMAINVAKTVMSNIAPNYTAELELAIGPQQYDVTETPAQIELRREAKELDMIYRDRAAIPAGVLGGMIGAVSLLFAMGYHRTRSMSMRDKVVFVLVGGALGGSLWVPFNRFARDLVFGFGGLRPTYLLTVTAPGSGNIGVLLVWQIGMALVVARSLLRIRDGQR